MSRKIISLILEVLSEVEKACNEISSYLTRVEHIVANAKGISEEAVVTGLLSHYTSWSNPDSGNEGQITIVNSYRSDEGECRTLKLSFKSKDGAEGSVNRYVCLSSEAVGSLLNS